jgi:WD40 repeat protein
MRHSHPGRFRQQVQVLRRQFLQRGDLPFTDILTEAVLARALAALRGPWLDRIFSPLVTLWVFLGQVLSADHSCRAAVARLIAHRLGRGRRERSRIWCLAFSPDNKRLASAGLDWEVKVWEWNPTRLGKDQEPKPILPVRVNGFTNRVTFSADGQHLITGGEVQSVKAWDVTTGQLIQTLHGHTGDVYCVAVSPNGRWIASAGVDTTVRLWDATTWKPLHKLRGHTGVVSSLAFSPDSKHLVSGSRDKTVKVWDLTRLDKKLKE